MREISTITAFCPFNNTGRKLNKKELVRFINTVFNQSTDKIVKIEKINTSTYLINSNYKFTKDELEYYLYDEYLDFIR